MVALNHHKSQTSVPTVLATENWWIKKTWSCHYQKVIYWQILDRLIVAWVISHACSCLYQHRFLIRNKMGRYKHENAVFNEGLSNCIIVFFTNVNSCSLANYYLFNHTEKKKIISQNFLLFFIYIFLLFFLSFPTIKPLGIFLKHH